MELRLKSNSKDVIIVKENNEFYIVEKYYSKKFVSVVVAGYESETWECPKCGGIFLNQKSDLLVYFKGEYVYTENINLKVKLL